MNPSAKRAAAVLLLTGSLAACGARSALLERSSSAGGSGGAGGAGSSSSSGGGAGGLASSTASATASVGSGPLCNLWDATATWIAKGSGAFFVFAPHLVPVTDSLEDVVLVYLQGDNSPPITPYMAQEVYFSAWGPGFQDQDLLFPDSKYQSVPPDLAVGSGIFGGTHSIHTLQSQSTLALYPSVPDASVVIDPIADLAQPGVTLRPLFVGQREHTSPKALAELLQGFERTEAGKSRLSVRIVSSQWGDVLHPQSVACASSPLIAAAAGWKDEFLVATSSSRPLGKCDDPADPLGAPTLVQVSFYHLPLGQVILPILELDAGAPVTYINTFPAGEDLMNDGAWVVHGTTPEPGNSTLHVARFDPTGKLLSAPFDVPAGPFPLQGYAASTRLGDRLALAWPEPTGESRYLQVAIFDRTGAMLQSFKMVPPSMTGATILGSPDGKQLLVAFTDGDDNAQVIRYGCQ